SKRRETLLKSLGGSIAIVAAGDGASGSFKTDANFVYLTGIENESGAFVLFDGGHPQPERRIALFLRPVNSEAERWDGYRAIINAELKKQTGFGTVLRTSMLPGMVTAALRRAKQAACVLPFAVYPAAVSADLAIFQQVAQRIPGVRIEDRTGLLLSMRATKSPAEIALIVRAAEITELAYRQAVPHIRPGLNEGQLQLALETVYKQQGGGIAYGTIVGGGMGGTVLHYIQNNRPLEDGHLVVIDSAASFGGYASDVTRTYPVNGKFTADQREVYEVVLASQLAAIKASKPGVRLSDIDAAARTVIDKAGLGDAFIHSIGHPLGLSVHDAVPDHPLKANTVITIEPGVYLPDRQLGVRIEDDLLLTRAGNKNLTAKIPKTVKEIEAAMRP
ncbi:MAG: Xaa-Pro aminopeptidase, partial [Phycisphaerales bacterium]|nr:Xaa-Pro aminopeptidase [Phycisphaerales bacterium]